MKTFSNIGLMTSQWMLTLVLVASSFLLGSCEKDMHGKIYQVADQMMMDEILESKGDTLSAFLQIVDLSGLRGTIHAYGAYTLFAPTNEAVQQYLSERGITMSQLSESQAADIVKYHLIADTIPSSEFVDGRLPMINFMRRYITTQTIADPTGVYILVNRQGRLIQRDLRGGNGYVHIVDKVLFQSPNSITDVINNLPESFSLWKEAYTQSGIQDFILQEESKKTDAVFTCFIQDNEAFASAGIHNMSELMAELREKNSSITDDDLLLYNYIAYHMVAGFRYVVDLINQSSLQTLVEGEVIVLKKDLTQILLNEFFIGGVLERGVPVDRSSYYTDLSCSNGVIHQISGNIQIVKRSAFRVYWDIAEQPELMAMKNFRKAGASIVIDNTDLEGITWAKTFETDRITYNCGGLPLSINPDNNYVYGDHFRFRLSTNTMKWIEFKTPVLVPGTYKVWFSYRGLPTNGTQQIRCIFKQEGQEDQQMGVTTTGYNVQPSTYGLTGYTNEYFQKAALDGYRNHMINSALAYDNRSNCQAIGIVQVFATGQHILRMEPLLASQFITNWDQFLFIPIDEDQIWPKQDIPGKMIYEHTQRCEIYPYFDCPTEEPAE